MGTRFIELDLVMTSSQGSYNDGYADNLELRLNSQAAPVPEPSTLFLLGSGLFGFVVLRKRFK